MYGLKGLGDVYTAPPLPADSGTFFQATGSLDNPDYLTTGMLTPSSTALPAATSQTFSQWLNANAGKAAIGVAAVLALVFVAKAGR